jgi:AraC-like DNA-binding protein
VNEEIVSSSNATGDVRWETVRREPAAHLREFVHDYVGYYDDSGGFRQLTVPSGAIVMILGFGSEISLLPRPGRDKEESHWSFVAGLQDVPGIIEGRGLSYGIQVDMTPIGARLLTGLPMHELTNRVLDVDAVFGIDGPFLVERLAELADWATRFQILDAFIESRIARATPPAGVLWAYHRLEVGEGSIASLSEELGYSQKHLIAQFREHVGLPPKTMARILRFDRAMRLMRGVTRPDFAAIAAETGYYDQAHFNREFREFSGTTPGEFAAARVAGSDYPMERTEG